ncbi:hemolysin family protein [Candidatus Gracilibacteria bacterium]|nr:hemolysin family protein [Candidatus Gracilibacteria bacterium]
MDPSQYFLFLVLFILSGFFSGTELALMSLPQHKVDSLVRQKRFGSQSLAYIKSQSDKLLITILVGNNLVNVYAAALATQISLSLALTSGIEQSLAVAVATGLITFLILVFGEIIPKSVAVKNAEIISLAVAYPYKAMMTVFFPVIFFLERLIMLFTGKNVVKSITAEEIESFLDMGKDTGTLEDGEHERLRNTLEFSETLIEEVMVPRVRLDAISGDKTVSEALEYYLSHTHSRIPVYSETIDKIIGIFTIRDLVREKQGGNDQKALKDIHFKPIIKVPLNQPLDILLETFRQKRQHIAIVMDEYGGVAGIVTLEDVVEQILGDLHDETDKEIPDVIHSEDGSILIDASITIDEVLDEFELTHEDIGFEVGEFSGETVGYVITHQLERFAEPGELLSFPISGHKNTSASHLKLEVLSLRDGAIEQVRVLREEAGE